MDTKEQMRLLKVSSKARSWDNGIIGGNIGKGLHMKLTTAPQ